jgi:hypothetical protein
MSSRLLFALALAALGGCATRTGPPDDHGERSIRLNETAHLADLKVTPTAVLEDSRCPSGVQCIQAGTVRVQARIVDRGGSRTETLSLGVPVALQGRLVALAQACPHPRLDSPIRPSDYRFTLVVATATVPSLFEVPGCRER